MSTTDLAEHAKTLFGELHEYEPYLTELSVHYPGSESKAGPWYAKVFRRTEDRATVCGRGDSPKEALADLVEVLKKRVAERIERDLDKIVALRAAARGVVAPEEAAE